MRIEQPQPREVSGQPQLGGRGGEEQQAGGLLRERLDKLIIGAGLLGRPTEVMRFVYDDQIPARGDDLLAAFFVARQKAHAGERKLAGKKRVFLGFAFLAGGAPGLVENGQPQIETPQQFDEPLVHQRFGHQNQRAFGAANGEQALEDQAGLDGFAETHFIREQHARDLPARDFVENVELVRNQIDATAEKPAHFRLAELRLHFQRAMPQIENFGRIGLAGEQAFGG